mgnify:CR=1 FL=1
MQALLLYCKLLLLLLQDLNDNTKGQERSPGWNRPRRVW